MENNLLLFGIFVFIIAVGEYSTRHMRIKKKEKVSLTGTLNYHSSFRGIGQFTLTSPSGESYEIMLPLDVVVGIPAAEVVTLDGDKLTKGNGKLEYIMTKRK